MAWTSPRTWVAGETVTAAIMNTHVRDQFKAIGDPWTTFTPTLFGVTTSAKTGKYLQAGKWVRARVSFTLNAAPGSTIQVAPPVAASTSPAAGETAPVGVVSAFRAGVAFRTGVAYLASSTIVAFLSDGVGGPWNSTIPTTWASGDTFGLSIDYEAA